MFVPVIPVPLYAPSGYILDIQPESHGTEVTIHSVFSAHTFPTAALVSDLFWGEGFGDHFPLFCILYLEKICFPPLHSRRKRLRENRMYYLAAERSTRLLPVAVLLQVKTAYLAFHLSVGLVCKLDYLIFFYQ